MRIVLKAFLFLSLVTVGAYLAHQSGLAQKLNPREMEAFLDSAGIYAPLAFILLAVLRPLLFVPAGLISIVGGLVFGALFGTLYTLAGSGLGALLAFGIARLLAREPVRQIARGRLDKWSAGLTGQGASVIFMLRLVPIFPFDAISYAAGLSKLKLKDFALGTVLGMIPGTFVYNFLGSTIYEGFGPRFLGAVLLAAGITIIPTVYRLRSARRPSKF